MTAIATLRNPAGHYRFPQAARMEWIKLRSLRSTWWTLAVTAAAATGIGIAVGLNTRNASGDLTNNALAGIPALTRPANISRKRSGVGNVHRGGAMARPRRSCIGRRRKYS